MASFGEKIRIARKNKGITQKELAIAVGVKHNSVSNWEQDKNKPDVDCIELICGILDISPSYLMDGYTVGELVHNELLSDKDIAIENLICDNSTFSNFVIEVVKTYYGSDDQTKKSINLFVETLKSNLSK